jgi:hypothetical protein
MSERDLQRLVIDALDVLGCSWIHISPGLNRRGHWSTPIVGSLGGGWPDAVRADRGQPSCVASRSRWTSPPTIRSPATRAIDLGRRFVRSTTQLSSDRDRVYYFDAASTFLRAWSRHAEPDQARDVIAAAEDLEAARDMAIATMPRPDACPSGATSTRGRRMTRRSSGCAKPSPCGRLYQPKDGRTTQARHRR